MVHIDAGVNAAYEDVRNDKSDTNWLLLAYADEKGDMLKLLATGTRGLEEFKSHLKSDEASFGYIRMVVGNDELVSIVFKTPCSPVAPNSSSLAGVARK
jgi:hypothetical protein